MPVPQRHLPIVRTRGTVSQKNYEHWHLTRDRKGQFRTTSKENPIDFVKHRAYWLGGLAAVAALAIGGIAYAAGKSAGASQAQTQSVALTIPGAGSYSNTYPKGSTVTINLPSGGQWSGSGVQVTNGSANFSVLSAPTTGGAAAQVVYNGSGGQLTCTWTDSTQTQQTTTLTFNG